MDQPQPGKIILREKKKARKKKKELHEEKKEIEKEISPGGGSTPARPSRVGTQSARCMRPLDLGFVWKWCISPLDLGYVWKWWVCPIFKKGIIRYSQVPGKTELVKHKWYNERHTCRSHDVQEGGSERKQPLWYLPRKGFPENGQFRTCVEQRTFSENQEILVIHLFLSHGYVRVPLPRPSKNNITDNININSI